MKTVIAIEKTNLIETNEAYQKILYWFFSFPNKEIGLSELAKELKISKTTANKKINRLVKEGFLKKEIIGKSWRLSCNTNHIYNKSKKISYNLSMVYESGIVDKIIGRFNNAKAIVLFGSYRKGDDNEKSDIDIAVETLNENGTRIEEFVIIKKFGYRKDVKVNLYIFVRDKVNTNLFSNISNGIVINGFLEVKK